MSPIEYTNLFPAHDKQRDDDHEVDQMLDQDDQTAVEIDSKHRTKWCIRSPEQCSDEDEIGVVFGGHNDTDSKRTNSRK